MLELRLLGKMAIELKRGIPINFRTRKAEAIVAYLAIRRQAVMRVNIAELFWPAMTTTSALKNLRVVLSDLREKLGDYLLVTSDQLALNLALAHRVDLYRFDKLMEDQPLPMSEQLTNTLRLFQRELLEELTVINSPEFTAWLQQEQAQLQQRKVACLTRWAEEAMTQQTYEEGSKVTQLWLQFEPWNEDAHRMSMYFFWKSDQRSAALLQYEICRQYLGDVLGIEPSTETKHLHLQIQESKSADNRSSKAQSSDYPSVIPHNLPRQFTNFTGREQEIKTLSYQLLEKKLPLITIVGEGGAGKTRLAIATADQIVTMTNPLYFPDGVWLISCVGIAADNAAQEQLIITIGSTIGLRFQGRVPLSQQLINYLADQSMLLILDNFEYLTNLGLFLVSLLESCQNVQLLVTSRRELGLHNVWTFRLSGLPAPQSMHSESNEEISDVEFANLCAIHSVQLFQNRAQHYNPTFAITKENCATVAALCDLLDGNPLALELAAAQLTLYDIVTLQRELTENYRLLASELQDLPVRQRSIHTTIDYSWRMLHPQLASQMAQCSVFRGKFDYAAVAAITGGTLQQIQQLIQCCMLYIDTQKQLLIHEMVRQFAAEKLALNYEFQLQTQQQHCEFYLGQLSLWWEKGESRHIPSLLFPLLDNIYAAWEWAFSNRRFGILCQTVIPYTLFHGYAGLYADMLARVEEYVKRLNEIIAFLPADADLKPYQEMQIAFDYMRAKVHTFLLRSPESFTLLQNLKAQVEQHGYRYLLSEVEYGLAIWYGRNLEIEKEVQYLYNVIIYAEEQKQPYAEIRARLGLAFAFSRLGKYQESQQHLQESYQLLQNHPDSTLEIAYFDNKGNNFHADGQWTKAIDSFKEIIKRSGQSEGTTHFHHCIGKILWQSGRYEEAKEYLEQVDPTNRNDFYQVGTYWHIIWLVDFANLYVAWEKPDMALFYSELAEKYSRKLNNDILLGRSLKAQGAAQLQLDKYKPATENLNQSYKLFCTNKAADHQCTALIQLIYLNLKVEEFDQVVENTNALWDLLETGSPDLTNVEPTKAFWACYMGFSFIGDERAAIAMERTKSLFQTQLANIEDANWQQDFSTQIREHQQLLQILKMNREH